MATINKGKGHTTPTAAPPPPAEQQGRQLSPSTVRETRSEPRTAIYPKLSAAHGASAVLPAVQALPGLLAALHVAAQSWELGIHTY